MSLRSYAAALGGVVSGNQVCFPGPGHSRQDRSCTLRLSPASPDGFVVFSFAGDDWRTVRDHVRNRLGLAYKQHHAPARQQGIPSENNNTAFALELSRASVPFYGTPGEAYLREERGIVLRNLDHLSHCLRWNYRKGALVALMTDAVTNAPTGVHRIFLDDTGAKLERRMLGRQGVVRLTPDKDVTYGLGIAEGIETALAILADGFAPVWAATSAAGIARFPVLAGLDALTVFADPDQTGLSAARACAERWNAAGKEAEVLPPSLSSGGAS
jgi:hypothetical protein